MRTSLAVASLVLFAGVIGAQRPAARPLGAVVATSKEALGALSGVRELPGGKLLVNDPSTRRVLLMDSTLTVIGTVADSTPSTANAYGPRAGGLIAWRGDSTLFVDPASLSMLMIDGTGKIVRVMAAPRPADVAFLTGGVFGTPGLDARGRLVYRSFTRPAGGPPAPGQPFTPPAIPDSMPVIRFDLASRTLDTAGFIRTPKVSLTVTQTERGMNVSTRINPLNVVDDWAMMPDGSIAFVRGRDYRVDYLNADGTRTIGAKIAYDWQHLSDSAKVAVVDSARKLMEAMRAGGAQAVAAGAAIASATGSSPVGITGGGGPVIITSSTGPGGGTQTTVGGPPPAGAGLPALNFVDPSELPDYRPAFSSGASRADREGRLWVRTIPVKPLAGGAEYDVIDRSGTLVERVAIPKGTTIIGFGAAGNVYLGIRDTAGVHVVRARMR